MSKQGYPFRCTICNLFISYKDMQMSVSWVPYGDGVSGEPPDDVIAHRRCWDAQSERDKMLAITTSWQKPYPLEAKP